MPTAALPIVKNDPLNNLSEKVLRMPELSRTLDLFEKANAAHFAKSPATPPAGETAWFHYYVCKDSSAKLIFDPTKPHEHVSPNTGKVHSGDPYDSSWRAVMHGVWIGVLERAALLERTGRGSESNRQMMRDTLLYWAKSWHGYKEKHRAGIGKLMPQGLTEAIFQLSVCQILQWVPDLMQGEDLETLKTQMLIPAAEFLLPQWTMEDRSSRPWAGAIHNIACWLNASKYALGWALNDNALKDIAINGPVGWLQQVEQGIHNDGWWYEKTLTYQGYTLTALLSLAVMAKADGTDLFNEPKLAKMATAVLKVMRSDGTSPNWHDGWRGASTSGMLNPMEVIAGCSSDGQNEEIAANLSWFIQHSPDSRKGMAWSGLEGPNTWIDFPLAARDSVASVVWGLEELPAPIEPDRKSVFFPDSGIAVMTHGDIQLSMRSGPYGGGHDHLDRTDITVSMKGHIIADDIGTPGYGSDIIDTWYRQPASHRLLIINRERQQAGDGQIIKADNNEIIGVANEAWPDTQLKRQLTFHPNGDGFTDQTTATPPVDLQVDWVFHLVGNPIETEVYNSISMEQANAGLDFITDRKHIPGENSTWSQSWETAAGKLSLSLVARGLASPELTLGVCPDNPADQKLSAVVLSGLSTNEPVSITAKWDLV